MYQRKRVNKKELGEIFLPFFEREREEEKDSMKEITNK